MNQHLASADTCARQIARAANGLYFLGQLLSTADPEQEKLACLVIVLAIFIDETTGELLSELREAAPAYHTTPAQQ